MKLFEVFDTWLFHKNAHDNILLLLNHFAVHGLQFFVKVPLTLVKYPMSMILNKPFFILVHYSIYIECRQNKIPIDKT